MAHLNSNWWYSFLLYCRCMSNSGDQTVQITEDLQHRRIIQECLTLISLLVALDFKQLFRGTFFFTKWMMNGSNDFLILHCKTALSCTSVYECVCTWRCVFHCVISPLYTAERWRYMLVTVFFILFFTAIIYVTNIPPPSLKQYHLHTPSSTKVHKLL